MRLRIASLPNREAATPPPVCDTSGFAPSQWVSEAEFLALRAHPELPGAVAKFGAWLIETYTQSALLNLVLSDRGRVLLGLYLLYLDVLPLPGTQQHGATLSAVQSLCRSTGLCSAGRAASMIALMRFGGYVTQTLDPNDRRRRILVPAPRLVSVYHRNWVQQFEAMVPIFPAMASVPGWLERPAFRSGFLRALSSSFFAGFRVLDHTPVLKPVGETNAAMLILTALALQLIAGESKPGETMALSISGIARRFRVSRAHVRNVLRAAEAAGLVAYGPHMDAVVVLPALTEALLQFYGVVFIIYKRSAAMARTEDRSTQ